MRGKIIAAGGIILIFLGAHLFSLENPTTPLSVQSERGTPIRVTDWFDALCVLLTPQ